MSATSSATAGSEPAVENRDTTCSSISHPEIDHKQLDNASKETTRYDAVYQRLYDIFDGLVLVDDTVGSIKRGYKALSAPPKIKPTLTADSTYGLGKDSKKTFPALLTWLGEHDLLLGPIKLLDKESRDLLERQSLIKFMKKLAPECLNEEEDERVDQEINPSDRNEGLVAQVAELEKKAEKAVQKDTETLQSIGNLKADGPMEARSIVESLSAASVHSISENMSRIEERGKLQSGTLQWINLRWNTALDDLEVPRGDPSTKSAVDRHLAYLISEQTGLSESMGSIDPAERTMSKYRSLRTQIAEQTSSAVLETATSDPLALGRTSINVLSTSLSLRSPERNG